MIRLLLLPTLHYTRGGLTPTLAPLSGKSVGEIDRAKSNKNAGSDRLNKYYSTVMHVSIRETRSVLAEIGLCGIRVASLDRNALARYFIIPKSNGSSERMKRRMKLR